MAKEPVIIEVPNRLKAKVSYGPDGVDAQRLEQAEAMISALAPEYLSWVIDDLKRLQSALDVALATAEDARPAAVRAIFEISHDMKGQGGSFNYGMITQVGALLCNFIEARASFDAQEMEVIRLHVEAMRLVIGQKMEGDGGRPGQSLLKGLQAVIAKVSR
ncbi:MAG TPA: phosphorelay protein [Rhodospirillaceae bacterium]|nr:phosphorelay protein [Rhodospirillaceae bacterium]